MKDTDSQQDPLEIQTMPRITVIIRYKWKMKNKTYLDSLLRLKADETEKELLNDYPRETVLPLVNKLRNIIESVRCPGKGKTLAIFISPFAEKVYYFSPSHLEDYKLPDTVETTDE